MERSRALESGKATDEPSGSFQRVVWECRSICNPRPRDWYATPIGALIRVGECFVPVGSRPDVRGARPKPGARARSVPGTVSRQEAWKRQAMMSRSGYAPAEADHSRALSLEELTEAAVERAVQRDPPPTCCFLAL